MSMPIDFWKQEEQAAFSGWDFSRLAGRMIEEPLPWSYEKWLREFLKPTTRLLDMGTGGGEFLLSLRHPYGLTWVTEGWEPNFQLCKKRLEPLGITLSFWEKGPMPFENESFDLVLNRHESYDLQEVFRVLRPGGHFITQQVGAENGLLLSQRLGLRPAPENPAFNLENEAEAFRKTGFKVVKGEQAYPKTYFTDIGALCYFAKIITWEYPGFSVEKCLPQLNKLQAELEKQGRVELREHRFILIGKKQCGKAL